MADNEDRSSLESGQFPACLSVFMLGTALSVCFGLGDFASIYFLQRHDEIRQVPFGAMILLSSAVLWYALLGGIIVLAITLLACGAMALSNRSLSPESGSSAMSAGLLVFPPFAYFAIYLNKQVLDWLPATHFYSLVTTLIVFSTSLGVWLLLWFPKLSRRRNRHPLDSRVKSRAVRFRPFIGFLALGFMVATLFPFSSNSLVPPPKRPTEGSKPIGAIRNKPNLLLVTIDSLRADHMSSYGYSERTSPYLDQLASRGTLFENFFTHSSWTFPSMASLLTSLYPSQHGILRHGKSLPEGTATLANVLGREGYQTASFGLSLFESKEFGFHQATAPEHFPRYPSEALSVFTWNGLQIGRLWSPILREKLRIFYLRDDLRQWYADAHTVNTTTRQWMQGTAAPFFLHVHYQDPHDPYLEHPVPFLVTHFTRRRSVAAMLELYDGEIRYVDEKIGEFLKAVASRFSMRDTLLIITADHGEEFLDHGAWGHGRSLYDELLHVPLLVVWEGKLPANQRLRDVVREIDIAPTVLDLLEIDIPETMMGQSLAPLIYGTETGDRIVRSQVDTFLFGLESIRDRQYKLILTRRRDGSKSRMLFDWRADPYEKHDLAKDLPELADTLEERLERSAQSSSTSER